MIMWKYWIGHILELQQLFHFLACAFTFEILWNGCAVASGEVIFAWNKWSLWSEQWAQCDPNFLLTKEKIPTFILPFSVQRNYSLEKSLRLGLYWYWLIYLLICLFSNILHLFTDYQFLNNFPGVLNLKIV